jgi:hypothetical protein
MVETSSKTKWSGAIAAGARLAVFAAVRILSAAVCLLALGMAARVHAGQESNHDAVVSAKISRPVSPTRDLPALSFAAGVLVRDGRAVPYKAIVFASLDGAGFAPVASLHAQKGVGGNVVSLLSKAAARPGFHSIRIRVDLVDTAAPESFTLAPIYYAIYDMESNATAQIRALVYAPASALARELDPQLGDEPFPVWLSEMLSTRRSKRDIAPEWWSDYCDNRTADPTRALDPTAICSVVGFMARGDLVQMWFRTADIVVSEHAIEWVPLVPAKFEGMTIRDVPETRGLAALPSLLDTPPQSREVGDISILPDQIVYGAGEMFGAPADVTVSVRNIGGQDLHKVSVMVAWGVDVQARTAMRQFVVDVPARQATEIKVPVTFPNGYGFIMAHAMSLTEHSPFGTSTPDPTPGDDCAFRVINPQFAPAKYRETLVEASAGGCSAK